MKTIWSEYKGRLLAGMLCLLASLPSAHSFAGKLDDLDAILADRHRYEQTKRKEIETAKANYATATADSDRYNVLRHLYQAYRNFRIDSALIMADERLAVARRMGVPSKIGSASLNLAESFVKSGMPDEALHILDTLSTANLEDYHMKYRNSVQRGAYELKAATSLLPADILASKESLRRLRDEALAEAEPGSKGYYVLTAEKLSEAGLYNEAVAKMEEADSKFDFSGDAGQLYSMAEIYLAAGKKQQAMDCLAKSASIDLSSGIKEYRSLILLASLLFEEGDVKRAFDYINVAFEDAHFAHANMRTPEIMDSMPVINQAFHAYEKETARHTRVFLILTAVLAALLLAASFFLWRTLRANRKMLKAIEEINATLQRRNKELVEADSLKLQNINTLILSNARYISRLKDFRKNVYRQMKTGQYDKALDMLKSDRTDSKDIAAFHEMFDETFLSMFPGFVEGVNKYLSTPVVQKEAGRLTPELRVMALMRLGLSSTEDISRILHYSAQTVYNLRTTIRGMTPLSKEEFEEKLKNI